MTHKTAYDAVHMYMSEITSRLVAKTGIPTDRHHLGKIILQSLQDDLDFVAQIDGATDESETTGSILNRSIQCAIALKNLGLKKDDVMVLIAPNHIDLCIPLYAALYLGIAIAGTDVFLGVNELKDTFNVLKPKIIFCQSEKVADIEQSLQLAGLESKIVTFNAAGCNHTTFGELNKDINDELVKGFQCTDFDPAETTALLTATSGTTGKPKAAILTHKNLSIAGPYIWSNGSKFPTPTARMLIMSPIQWLSAGANYLFCPVVKITRVQASETFTPDIFARVLNVYKPTAVIASPILLKSMLTVLDKCDFTCFEYIYVGGSAVPQDLIDELKLVDQHTQEDITEAKAPGELLVRGPTIFKGYYNNPELTASTLTEDGWLKTGDIFYRDEYWHFYFVERLKSLLKYRNHQVAPAEVEEVIKQHPGVLDVCVVGIPDSDCGDLVTACVVPKPGATPTAQEIKDIVKESLADSKQLRGGVVFVKELPLTSTAKINRKKVQEMVLTMKRE